MYIILSFQKGTIMDNNKRLDENLKWCDHIHNWGDAFYYVDTYNPFAVDGENVFTKWKMCPICGTKSPLS